MKELSKISVEEIDKMTDKMSEDILREIRKNSSNIDFTVLEENLKTKYTHDGHSAMFLDGRKGVRIIVDHGISKQWSEINCKTEIKIFKKCGMRIIDHTIAEKVYSYLVQPEEKFYKELEKIPDSEWLRMTNITKTISQDILGEIKKTAASIEFTLEEILKLMTENAYITELRSKNKTQ